MAPMWTRPESNVSRPDRQCSRVDFPDPDGPMMVLKRPRLEIHRDRVECRHGGRAGAVVLGGVTGPDGHGAGCTTVRRLRHSHQPGPYPASSSGLRHPGEPVRPPAETRSPMKLRWASTVPAPKQRPRMSR